MNEYLSAAIDEAREGLRAGGIPIGALLVIDSQIVGRGHNQRVQKGSSIKPDFQQCQKLKIIKIT